MFPACLQNSWNVGLLDRFLDFLSRMSDSFQVPQHTWDMSNIRVINATASSEAGASGHHKDGHRHVASLGKRKVTVQSHTCSDPYLGNPSTTNSYEVQCCLTSRQWRGLT